MIIVESRSVVLFRACSLKQIADTASAMAIAKATDANTNVHF